MADLVLPTDEYSTADSKMLVRNWMGWSKDVEMGSLSISKCNCHIILRDAYSAGWS